MENNDNKSWNEKHNDNELFIHLLTLSQTSPSFYVSAVKVF